MRRTCVWGALGMDVRRNFRCTWASGRPEGQALAILVNSDRAAETPAGHCTGLTRSSGCDDVTWFVAHAVMSCWQRCGLQRFSASIDTSLIPHCSAARAMSVRHMQNSTSRSLNLLRHSSRSIRWSVSSRQSTDLDSTNGGWSQSSRSSPKVKRSQQDPPKVAPR
jgi:hypothetical protein